MAESSSLDLHPQNGGRFVLERRSEDPPEYGVVVYLPEGQRLDATLTWDGPRARLEPALADTWAHDEALKLARAVRRGAKPSLSRWRGR